MIFKAYMMAFTGRDDEAVMVRPITVPDERVQKMMLATPAEEPSAFTDALLADIFYFGQNDFQPLQCPSLSVGDVVEITTESDAGTDPIFYECASAGWTLVARPTHPNGFAEVAA
jgi:hypothetical protein